jgi:hypothetical protein
MPVSVGTKMCVPSTTSDGKWVNEPVLIDAIV